MRPGCDRPAEVRLSYDTVSCQVWLDPVPELLGPVQEICEFHALRLTVPRGWVLCDRRVVTPTPTVPQGVPTLAPAEDRHIKRRHPNATASELFPDRLEEAADEVVATVDPADPDDGVAPSSDSDAGAVPTSPLLARAFAQTGPQRSVLSDDLRVPDQQGQGSSNR